MIKRTRPHCHASCSVTSFMVLWSLVVSVAEAQTPTGSRWWPSEWGPEDERGASHRITPARVVEAARLIQEGRIYSLGRLYEPGMPGFGNRHYSLTIPGRPTGGPLGPNQIVYNDELTCSAFLHRAREAVDEGQ